MEVAGGHVSRAGLAITWEAFSSALSVMPGLAGHDVGKKRGSRLAGIDGSVPLPLIVKDHWPE